MYLDGVLTVSSGVSTGAVTDIVGLTEADGVALVGDVPGIWTHPADNKEITRTKKTTGYNLIRIITHRYYYCTF